MRLCLCVLAAKNQNDVHGIKSDCFEGQSLVRHHYPSSLNLFFTSLILTYSSPLTVSAMSRLGAPSEFDGATAVDAPLSLHPSPLSKNSSEYKGKGIPAIDETNELPFVDASNEFNNGE